MLLTEQEQTAKNSRIQGGLDGRVSIMYIHVCVILYETFSLITIKICFSLFKKFRRL